MFALSVRCLFAICSVAKSAMRLRSAVISSSRREISDNQSSKTVMFVIRSLSVCRRRVILSARYVDMLSSSLERSAVASSREGVPISKLFPCMTRLANVVNDS